MTPEGSRKFFDCCSEVAVDFHAENSQLDDEIFCGIDEIAELIHVILFFRDPNCPVPGFLFPRSTSAFTVESAGRVEIIISARGTLPMERPSRLSRTSWIFRPAFVRGTIGRHIGDDYAALFAECEATREIGRDVLQAGADDAAMHAAGFAQFLINKFRPRCWEWQSPIPGCRRFGQDKCVDADELRRWYQ